MKRAQTLLIAAVIVALFAGTPLSANERSAPTMDLSQAITRGDLEQLNLHLGRGTSPDTPNEHGRTPLGLAIDAHRTQIVKRLLEAGADVNKPSRFGPPLVMAAARGHLDIVELLLANRADPNVKDQGGRTALLAAAEKHDKELVELLVANGADVNSGDKGGRTPLGVARRDEEISSFLRDHGAQEPVNPYDRLDPYMRESMPPAAAESGRSVGYQPNPQESGILDDPNAIRERLAAFPGIGKALQALDAKAASEERSWAQRRTDNRSTLLRMVGRQLAEELTFLKGVATLEKAPKTVAAVDELLATRAKRYDLIGADLREERRLAQQEARQMMGRGRGRGSRGRTSRVMPADAYGDAGMMGDPYGGPRPGGSPRGPGAEGIPEEALDPDTQNQLNAWLSANPQDKRSLLSTVHGLDLIELGELRRVASEEKIAKPKGTLSVVLTALTKPGALKEEAAPEVGAKKTTAAIEGLMLARQGRLDRIMVKMAQEDERLQRMADRYGNTQQMSGRGRRGRGMMPQQPDQPVQRRGRR